MSGFDKHWLALREPADQAARHSGLVDKLADHLDERGADLLVDIGCGTGSTWRSLNTRMPAGMSWLLLDNDPVLLEEAERAIGTDEGVTFRQHDLNDLEGLPLAAAGVVTASALFDLCSEEFCRAFAERVSASHWGLYAALNYDGIMHWSISHPLDEQMVSHFNDHQRTDKGFGHALGPDATNVLASLFAAKGFRVAIEDSPWILGNEAGELQRELLKGLRQPVLEMSGMPAETVDEWIEYRMAAISAPGSLCRVGHKDFLALPV